MRTLPLLFALVACGPQSGSGAAASYGPPDLEAAESCVKTRVWEARKEGWAMRSLRSQSMGPGETWPQPLTVYEGVEYRILACAEDHAVDIELLVYTAQGKVAQREEATGPMAELGVTESADPFVVVHTRDVPVELAVAVAVVYR